MSFISPASTLNIGDASSNTVNITEADILNLGTVYSNVIMRGINMPFSSSYAFFSPGSGNGSPSTNETHCNCSFPYSTTQYLLIQWGFQKKPGDNNNTTVTFNPSFVSIPYVFITKFEGGTGWTDLISVTTTGFTCNSSYNSSAKATINWFAIGLKNIL